jgi:DNA-binding LacI/PurR family transcriptional regulator
VDFPNDRFADKADQVFADAGPGYRAAVRHFAGRGLTRIHFVGCLQSVPRNERRLGHLEWRGTSMRIDPDSPLRQGAYRQAMSELGLPVSENMIHHAMFDAEFNAALAEKLLLLPAAERPEAVLCHSAEHASALTAAFAARGLKLAGAGVRATLTEEETSFIHADGGALGAAAAQLLLWRLANPERPPLRVGAAMRFVANTNETGETQ